MKTRVHALLLDCDGVLAETEHDGHLVAFNQVFEEESIPLKWGSEEYGELLAIGGGKERLRASLTPSSARAYGLASTEGEYDRLIRRLHEKKSVIFQNLVKSGAIAPRPGVKRLVIEALDAGWIVAAVSTSAVASVQAVLSSVVGEEVAHRVKVFGGDIVEKKKPAPDIYLHALVRLRVSPSRAVAVEDSPAGSRAAVAAGISTIVTQSWYTRGDQFPGASIVLTDLGEPAHPATIVRDPLNVAANAVVTVDTLSALLGRTDPGLLDRGPPSVCAGRLLSRTAEALPSRCVGFSRADKNPRR